MDDLDDIVTRIGGVVEDVTGNYGAVLTRDTAAGDVPGWDSMAHVNIIIALESAFGIRFTTADLVEIKGSDRSIGDLAAIVRRKQQG